MPHRHTWSRAAAGADSNSLLFISLFFEIFDLLMLGNRQPDVGGTSPTHHFPFRFWYRISGPLSVVINQPALHQYNLFFQLTLRIHRTRYLLTQCWKTLQQRAAKRSPSKHLHSLQVWF
eukprot:c20588_g1_i1.p1 GENE.c20588_g1_i1~~c20588_g1_i1.p1  ORF type:complete len:119 (-),score=16.73 c20588_g1_i1:376-732(-)